MAAQFLLIPVQKANFLTWYVWRYGRFVAQHCRRKFAVIEATIYCILYVILALIHTIKTYNDSVFVFCYLMSWYTVHKNGGTLPRINIVAMLFIILFVSGVVFNKNRNIYVQIYIPAYQNNIMKQLVKPKLC